MPRILASRSRGFTLVELLVVISLFTLLASIIVANVLVARQKARYAASLEFIGTLARANEATLFMYLPFDGNTVVAGDNTGINTVQHHAVSIGSNNGISGGAAEFDGNNDDYISFDKQIQVTEPGSTIIVSAWVYPEPDPNAKGVPPDYRRYIFSAFPGIGYFGYPATGDYAGLQAKVNGLSGEMIPCNDPPNSCAPSLSDRRFGIRVRQWNFITLMIRDHQSAEIWVDGRLTYKVPSSGSDPNISLSGLLSPELGRYGSTGLYKGKIDDVRVYLSRGATLVSP